MKVQADVVVVGAGIVGAQVALQVLRRGHSVCIVDPGDPGGEQAASYGNAAWLSTHSVIPLLTPGMWKRVPRWLCDPLGPLALRPAYLPRVTPWLLRYLGATSSRDKVLRIARALRSLLIDAPALHREVAELSGQAHLIDAGSGLMHVYRDREHFESESLGWEIRRSLGISWAELDQQGLKAREPNLDDRYRFGVFVGEAGHCRDPGAYTAGLIACCETLGASRLSAAALGFRQSGGRLQAVTTDQGEIGCSAAVLCASVRSPLLAAKAGDFVPMVSERGYHVQVEGAGHGPMVPMLVADRQVVITQLDEVVRCAGQVEIAGIEAAPNWHRADILRQHLSSTFPQLDMTGARTWMGHRPSTPDGMPCIGASRGIEGVVHAFGHGHVGLVASARTGRLAAQLVTGETPEIDITPFDPQRFR